MAGIETIIDYDPLYHLTAAVIIGSEAKMSNVNVAIELPRNVLISLRLEAGVIRL